MEERISSRYQTDRFIDCLKLIGPNVNVFDKYSRPTKLYNYRYGTACIRVHFAGAGWVQKYSTEVNIRLRCKDLYI